MEEHTLSVKRNVREAHGFAGSTGLPLLEMQKAYYIGLNAENGGAAFLSFDINFPDFDRSRFQAAWNRVWARHEALRVVVGDDGVQHVIDGLTPELHVADLRGLGPEERDRALAEARILFESPAVHRQSFVQIRISLLDGGAARVHFRFSLLIADGQGLAVLLGELAELYDCPEVRLLEPPSFTEAVRRLATSHPRREAASVWWRERMAALPGSPELPLSRATGAASLQRRRLTLDQPRWERLQAAAVARGVTSSMALCTALAEVVGRFSASDHFLLALMLSARTPGGELDRVVGNFSSLALLPVSPKGERQFGAWALALQRTFFEGMEQSGFSGLEVLSELNRRNNQALTAAAPVVFSSNLHLPLTTPSGKPFGPFSIYGSQWTHSELQTPQVLLDVSVSVAPDGELVIHWDGRDALFPAGLMESMAGSYLRLLRRLADATEAWEDGAFGLDAGSGTDAGPTAPVFRPLPESRLHEPFFEGLSRDPERLAVIVGERSLSHGQIGEVARSVAMEVTRHGIGPNQLVAVVLEKGWQQIAAVLGILAAGAAYLPVDPSLPKARRFFLIENGEARLAITSADLEQSLEWPSRVATHVLTDSPHDVSAESFRVRPGPNDLAYVIFTSGTTGTPKGVMIEHQAVANTVADINARFDIGEDDRVFGISALNFDLSVWDIFGVLGAGGQLVLPSPGRVADPAHWYELMHTYGVTVWNSAPPVMQLLVEYAESINGNLPGTLRLVMMSGDWIPTTLPDRIRALSQADIHVVSLGGATEASIWSIIYPISRVSPEWPSIPYGKALANQSIHILDSSLRWKPQWVPGEIYIGGVGLARGYWEDPRKTAASFVVHPGTGERLYRTGDLGRLLPDGNVEFLGRQDGQIKLRGYRIELGEVESLLLRHPEVSAAAAGVREQGSERILVAYCVPTDSSDKASLPERLTEALSAELPSYMVPQTIFVLPRLPLSSNGKVDRKTLARLELEEARESSLEGANETETALAGIMAEILGRETVGLDESFFRLGGNSFAAVRLMARVRQVFGADLPLSALLRNQDVRCLARLLEAGDSGEQRLVQMREDSGATPVFFIHAAGGNVFSYQRLSEALPAGVPFYALEAKGLTAGEAPVSTIEEMAADYAEQVATKAGTGPVILGGWSSGGVVAVEMAHRLAAAGVEVSHLLLLDSPAPLERAPVSEPVAVEWFITDLFGGRPMPGGSAPSAAPAERLRAAIEARLGDGPGLAGSQGRARLERAYGVFRGTLDALRAYEPRALSIPTTIFKAQGPPIQEFLSHPALHQDDWGWRRWLAHLTIRSLAGNHYQILEGEAVIAVAQAVAQAVEQSSQQ